MTIDVDTAVQRLTSGYWNAQSVSASNPGGFGNDGHLVNLPALAEALGVVGDHVGTIALTVAGSGAISTTPVTIELGEAAFATAGLWEPAADVVIVARRAADPDAYLVGPVTSVVDGTITIDAQVVAGAGEHSDWILMPPLADSLKRLVDETGPALGDDLDAAGFDITGAGTLAGDTVQADGRDLLKLHHSML